jgi:hypothetical protein
MMALEPSLSEGGGGSGAPGYVTVSEPTSTGRQVLVL